MLTALMKQKTYQCVSGFVICCYPEIFLVSNPGLPVRAEYVFIVRVFKLGHGHPIFACGNKKVKI